MSSWIIRSVAPVLMLAGCVEGRVYSSDVGPLRVTFDDANTFFTGSVRVDGVEVEPTPYPGSLVVTRPDGTDLPYSREISREAEAAMSAYCEAETGSGLLSYFSFQNDRWAGLCRDPAR